MIPDLTAAEIARFRSKLSLAGCGLRWAGSDLNSHGYGRFAIYRDGKRIRILTHRLAYKLATGEDPGESLVRHGCDMPLCCTPDCLSLGTQTDNMRDAIERGRIDLSGLAARREAATSQFRTRLESGAKCCPDCTVTKPLTDFYRNRSSRDGRAYICRDCERIRKRTSGLGEDERAVYRDRWMREGRKAGSAA